MEIVRTSWLSSAKIWTRRLFNRQELDACLVTSEEFESGIELWSSFKDPYKSDWDLQLGLALEEDDHDHSNCNHEH